MIPLTRRAGTCAGLIVAAASVVALSTAATAAPSAPTGRSFSIQRLERVCAHTGGELTAVGSITPTCVDADAGGAAIARAERVCERLGGELVVLHVDDASASWACDLRAL